MRRVIDLILRSVAISVLFVSTFSAHAEECGGEIVVIGNEESIIPLADLSGKNICILNIGHSEKIFHKYCGFYAATEFYEISSEDEAERVDRELSDDCIRLIAVNSHSHWAVHAVKQLSDNNTVVIYFIDEKYIPRFVGTEAGAVIVAGENSEDKQILAAEAVFGGQDILGRLCNNVKGLGKKGDGVDIKKTRLGFTSPTAVGFSDKLENRLDSIVRLNIKRHSFPGCQIVVAKDGEIVINKSYGHLSYFHGAPKVNDGTLYDIASMTKATATVAGLMLAYDKGLYQLDVPISDYLPELKGNEIGKLTPRELMHHETGMSATLNTYALMVDSTTFTGKLLRYKSISPNTIKIDKGVYANRDAKLRTDIFKNQSEDGFETEIARGIFGGDSMRHIVSDAIYSIVPGEKKYRYSCLNFCILKDLEERLTGVGHDTLLYRNILDPLGADHMMFRPSDRGLINNVAPTEKDNFLRRQLLQGYVHDEIAAYSGGVQGNAGLFSNALDVAKLCQAWLDGGVYGGVRIFSEPTVDLFLNEKSKNVDRGLGFDLASRLKSMDKIGLPKGTFGHTGFTGTCFWVDPVNRIIVVFLCNRINPSRDNPAFNELSPRVAVMKAVYDSLQR